MTQDSVKEMFTFTWHIENFSMCPHKKGESITSPAFVADSLGKTRWVLCLFPKGETEFDGEYVSCFLQRKNKKEEPEEITTSYSINLMNADTQLIKRCSNNNQVFKKTNRCGSRNFISLNTLFEYKEAFLPNDVLTLQCCIWPASDENESPAEPKETKKVLSTTFSLEEISSVVSEDSMSTEHCHTHCSFHTRIPVERRQITWTIKKFNSELRTKKRIPVSLKSNLREKSALLLSCYATEDWNSDGSVKIDIQRKDRDFTQMLVRCKVSLLDGNSVARESKEGEHLFGEDYEVWSFPPIIKLSTLNNLKSVLLFDDTLSLRCDFLISYKGEVDIFTESDRKTYNSISTDGLRNGTINLLNNREFTDVTLISEDLQFEAHKAIICAQSPVFRAMFSGDTQENRTGVVRITDIETETVRNIRNFLYTDLLPVLQSEDAMKLYSAADKYEILKLKKQCSIFLKYNLSLSNVCDVLLLADLHQDSDLMRSVIYFLRIHEKDVFQSNQWKELMKDNIQLAGETMHKMLTQTWD